MSQVTKLYEDDPSELYVPENTKADQDEAKIKASFGLSDSGAFVFGVGNPDGSNMLTTERVLTVRSSLSKDPLLCQPLWCIGADSGRCMLLDKLTSNLTHAAVRCMGQCDGDQ